VTPRYARLVSLLRAVDAREWIDAEAIEYLGMLVTWINATGEGPSVNGRALVLTEAGAFSLSSDQVWVAPEGDDAPMVLMQ
jgi:hypothetical protein